MRVFAWTINEPAEAERLALLGVDGIITDKPAEILRALQGARATDYLHFHMHAPHPAGQRLGKRLRPPTAD